MDADAVIRTTLAVLDRNFYYPEVDEVYSIEQGGTVVVMESGHKVVNFSSNDYLGLARHPKVIEDSVKALQMYGLGSGGSRLTAGTYRAHTELEEALANFEGTEEAVVFSAGYLANIGAITALTTWPLKPVVAMLDKDAANGMGSVDIFIDKLVHRSIIDGVALATSRLYGKGVKHRTFQHRDVEHLGSLLDSSEADSKLVITDGVFSLHGRIAPLDEIVRVAHIHKAKVYVDDAHGTGVLGKQGKGTAEFCGVSGLVDYPMGTLSKALGGQGGFVAGSRDLCRYLRVASRSYMFQTSLPPAVMAGVKRAIRLVADEPERRIMLLEKAARVNSELTRLGFETFGSSTQIIPVCFYGEGAAKCAYRELKAKGIFAPCYYYPAVPHEEAIVRINLTAEHTEEQVDRLLEALQSAGREQDVLSTSAAA